MADLSIPDRDHPPLHNLLICNNPSYYGSAWGLCPPQCRYRAWGELHSPNRLPEEVSRAD